ncbi:diacylglycerol kinase catalytic domain-containing protein [Hirsutella rhossiliensis]|uniref:Diacylglycerol kinase catalytic domain-containing protein n=1 Tax=Hirsutella rhossiliensis TaxID=111463 RepID=A0A9P8N7V5_9HYPO|nr:diacylglycerol kinase catalytic domain-containing protein [Hirsutella rhossiliensis]KAH0968364.1 diacylglycerol kinase catalytic domain-containing protein [Hirsutella rhossiliensis]
MDNSDSPVDKADAGSSLALAGDKSLTMDERHLILQDAESSVLMPDVVYPDPAFKKSRRSCWASVSATTPPGASGRRLIPLYNVLWAELAGTKVVITYAAQPSKTSITPESWTGEVHASDDYPEDSHPESFMADLVSRAYGEARPQRRAYVLINPSSGPGGALRKWEQDVLPLLEAARMQMDVVMLTRGGEAAELAEKVDIDKYDTIMACSGDGTPHEVFNGLARRADARRALSKIAVSHIPCGSGNAMSCNLYGSHRPVFAALAIIKGVVTPLDLVSITQGDRRFVSFLSQAIGIIAESDLATEHLRWMGSARFNLGVFTRVFRRKCYPCDLAIKVEVGEKDGKDGVRAHYKRHASDASLEKAPAPSDDDELPGEWELASHDKIGTFYCGNMAYMAPDINFFSAAIASDGCMDMVSIDGDLWPLTALKTLMSVETGKFFDSPHVSYKKVSAYRIIPREQEEGYISIDGERVPFAPFQAEVHRALGRVISKRGCFEADGPANWDSVSVAERLHA